MCLPPRTWFIALRRGRPLFLSSEKESFPGWSRPCRCPLFYSLRDFAVDLLSFSLRPKTRDLRGSDGGFLFEKEELPFRLSTVCRNTILPPPFPFSFPSSLVKVRRVGSPRLPPRMPREGRLFSFRRLCRPGPAAPLFFFFISRCHAFHGVDSGARRDGLPLPLFSLGRGVSPFFLRRARFLQESSHVMARLPFFGLKVIFSLHGANPFYGV